ncbi:MAG: OmpA family protein [Arenicella sp.]|nr:OmpA family protein [Arenicella sp.]
MKRCSLFCAGAWPFIFLPLLLLLPLLLFKWHSIEEDVALNARAELSTAGIEWANIETTNRGRDVLITGTPPNTLAIEFAMEKAMASYGVNRVDVSSDVIPILIPAVAAELKTIITGQSVVLRGTLADQESINMLVSQAAKGFGAGNVTNKLQVGENTAALPNLDGFFLSLVGKSFSLETLTASLIGNQLSLKGTINSQQANTMLATQMSNQLGLELENSLAVAPPPCDEQINELLSRRPINFASGRAVINDKSFELLENIKSATLGCPYANFEVSGHTDSTGKLNFNMKLSKQRAQAVIDHLADSGLDTTRFTATGYGPRRPIADNNTNDGRALNRRIEFKLKN